ncbi:MAG: DUF3881 family protein [Agathobacter sp.]|nr:DUF3881 family protein [Agathobacter sp.]
MHKFLKAIGFSDFRKKDLEIVINDIIERPEIMKVTKDSEGNEFAELSKCFGTNIGIMVRGNYDESDSFMMEYYYPYYISEYDTTNELIEVQKHSEKESYAGVCDESNVGVTLIFYLQNVADYLSEKRLGNGVEIVGAKLAALSVEGMIILPVNEQEEKEKISNYKYKERSQLIAQAREGNEDAIESLTIEDMDTYSMISRRVMREDILSIVNSCFMPYGIESDQYSIIGKINDFKEVENSLTKETIICMEIECNNLFFNICINKKDLIGEPAIGRRFKGNIWMQGTVCL